MTGRPPRRRLLRRMFLAQVLVVLAGGATLGAVAFVSAPPIFRDHVRRAVGPVSDVVAHHLDQALTETLMIALTIGIGASVVAAAGVSWLLAARIVRPIEDLSATAGQLAAGDLHARAGAPVADDELADLTAVFNAMATSLEETEQTRRQLLADLAHELRTPLATLEGYHEGLRDGVVHADPATLDVLADATDRLQRLIDDIALVSRAEEGRLDLRMQRLDLRDVAEAAVDAARPAADRSEVQLVCEAGVDPVQVEGDPDRLGQSLANLITNAIQHTPADGRVMVAVRVDHDHAVLDVADTGAGISADHLPHLFQRFYRADPARSRSAGSGIGLSISRAIVAHHGGRLTADSPGPGRGATFTIRLPIA